MNGLFVILRSVMNSRVRSLREVPSLLLRMLFGVSHSFGSHVSVSCPLGV